MIFSVLDSSPAASRVGLAKFRTLQATPDKKSVKESNFPNGWYYNEPKEEGFWNELEKFSAENTPQMIMSEKEKQQHAVMNDLNDSSTKIKSIIGQFDDIDQEIITLMEEIIENPDEEGTEPSQYLDNAKNNVVQFMTEINEISETQTALLGNLKEWFLNLSKNETFLQDEETKNSTEIDKGQLMQFLQDYIHETEEKMEKAQNLHNDVSKFWSSQISHFRKVINQKNGEISELKSNIEAAANARARRSAAKKEREMKEKSESNDEELMQTIQNQMRTIEEQKTQIKQLRAQLLTSQSQLALTPVTKQESSGDIKSQIAEKEGEIMQAKYESEMKVQMLEQRIHQLEKRNNVLQEDVQRERDKFQLSMNQINNHQTKIKELEASVNKYIKLLELEKNKPATIEVVTDTSKDELLEERLLEIARCKEQIRELNLKHREELSEQGEALRSRFAIEKQQLISAMESPDSQKLLQSIVTEYDKKFEDQKKAYDELGITLAQQWGAKLSLLTHQYETIIKNNQEQNEVLLLQKKEEIHFEVQKQRLDIEEKCNTRYLEISQYYSSEMNEIETKLNKLKAQNEEMTKEIKNYRDLLQIQPDENETISKDDETTKKEDDQNDNDSLNPIENYISRLNLLKNEFDEQKQWELEQQKLFYDQKLDAITHEQQIEIRKLLLRVQDSLSHVKNNGETALTVSEALARVSEAFVTLNKQLKAEKTENELNEEERIPLREASQRMNILTNKIIKLKTENKNLKNNDNQEQSSFDSELVNQLKMKIAYLESLQEGQTDEALLQLQAIEQELRTEIEVKNSVINDLQMQLSLEDNDIDKIVSTKELEPIIAEQINQAIKQDMKDFDLAVQFTDGNIEIPEEYFEEEEKLEQSEISANPLGGQDKPKVVVKTKVKTVIREVPVIEYRDQLKTNVKKTISLAVIFQIYTNEYANRPTSAIEIQPAMQTDETLFDQTVIQKQTDDDSNQQTDEIASVMNQSEKATDDNKNQQSAMIKTANSNDSINQILNLQTKNSIQNLDQLTNSKNRGFKESNDQMPNLQYAPEEVINGINILVDDTVTKEESLNAQNESITPIDAIQSTIDAFQTGLPYSEPEQSEANDSIDNSIPPHHRIIVSPIPDQPKVRILNQTIDDSIQSSLPPPNSPREIITVERIDVSTYANIELPVVVPEKVKIYISTPTAQVNIPMRITQVSSASRVIKKNGTYVIAEYTICSYEPRPPPPIVIAVDDDTKSMIDSLQDQIKNMTNNADAQKARNLMLRQIPEMVVYFRDREIKQKELQNESLKDRIENYETQQRKSRELRLAEIKRKSKDIFSIPRVFTGPANANPPPIKNEPQTTKPLETTISKTVQFELPAQKNTITSSPSNIVPIEEKVDFTMIQDPLGEGIDIVSNNLKFIANYIQTGNRISTEFNGDIDSFESFLRVTKSYEGNNEKFIEQMKESEKLIRDTRAQLNTFIVKQSKALALLKHAKKKEEELNESLPSGEKLKIQEKILGELQKRTEDPSSSINQLNVINQVEASLKVIDDLGVIDDDDDEHRIYKSLSQKVREYHLDIQNGKEVESIKIDSLIMETQTFITGIKPKINKKIGIESVKYQTENETLKKQLQKYKKALSKEEKLSSSYKDRVTSLESQLSLINSRLAEQKELAENSTSMYFAQIASIKSILSQLNTYNRGEQQNEDFISQIKNEVINLQVIADTAVHDKEIYKAKANAAEDRIMQADIEKANAIRELNELQAKFEKLDEKFKRASEEQMFHETDISTLRTEKKIEMEAKTMLNNQISKLIDDNANTLAKFKKKAEKCKVLKKRIEELNSEIDEMSIKLSLGICNRMTAPKTAKATQTMFKRVKRPIVEQNQPNSTTISTQSIPEPVVSNNQLEKVDPIERRPTTPVENNNSNVSDIENHSEKVPRNEYVASDEIGAISPIVIGNENGEGAIQLIDQNQSEEIVDSSDIIDSSLFTSQVEWEDEAEDNYGSELIPLLPDNQNNIIDLDEKAVNTVHQPLQFKKSNLSLQTLTTPKTAKKRPKTIARASRQAANVDDLTIGNVSPGKRQLTGATQTPKPLLPSKYHTNSPQAIPHITQHLEPLESLETSMITVNYYNNNNSNTEPVSPKGKRLIQHKSSPQKHTAPHQTHLTALNDLNDTFKITKFDVEPMNQPQITPKTPIITPKFTTRNINISSSNIANNSATMQQPQIQANLEEVHKVIVRLREKATNLESKLSKKNDVIDELKKKLSELTRENQQQRLLILKSDDEAKRSTHQYDSLKVRYDIITKELSAKEDELTKLKHEIIELRNITAPAASSLSRLRNAQKEQARIQQEKEIQKRMITIAKSAMTTATNAAAQKHLSTLMENTQHSLARLEAKRMMWKEIEKKQIMGALSALSLIDDKKSLIQLKNSFKGIPNSPFRNFRRKRKITSLGDIDFGSDFICDNFKQTNRNPQVERIETVHAKQMEYIDELNLDDNEKKQIIRGNVDSELAARIKQIEKKKEEEEQIGNAIIKPYKQ